MECNAVALYLEHFVVIWFCSLCMKLRIQTAKSWRWIVVLAPGMLCVHVSETRHCLLGNMSNLWVSTILGVLAAHLLFQGHFLKKLYITAICYVFMASGHTIIINVYFLLARDLCTFKVFVAVCQVAVLVLLTLFVPRFFGGEAVELSAKSWILLLLLPGASLFILGGFQGLFFQVWENPLLNQISFLSSIALMITNLIHFWGFRSIVFSSALHHQNQQMERIIAAQSAELDNLKRSQHETNKLIHNYKDDSRQIHLLLSSGMVQEAMEYLREATGKPTGQESVFYTGNLYIDRILNETIPFMKKMEIECSVYSPVIGSIPLNSSDLQIIIQNALNNALFSCIRQGLKGKLIDLSFSMDREKGCLLFTVSHPVGTDYMEQVGDSIYRYQLSEIQSVAEQCNGRLSCTIRDGTFILNVVLPVSGASGG